MKKLLILSLSVLFILTGCSAQNAQVAAAPEAVGAQTIYYLSGKIQALAAADLSEPFSGQIQSIPVNVGDTVKEGDSLIVFESSDLQAQVEISKNAYETALANLEKVKTGARPEQITQAEASFESAKISYDNAKQNYDRNKALFESKVISSAQMEAVEGQLSAAEAGYKSAEEQLSILKSGETKSSIKVLEKQAEQAKAVYEANQISLEKHVLKAPFDGMVIASPGKVGETYSPLTPLISLENRSNLVVDAYGPVSAVEKFEVGQSVKVKVAECPGETFDGTISWISDTIDVKKRAVLVKVTLNSNEELMVGMLTEIGIEQQEAN